LVEGADDASIFRWLAWIPTGKKIANKTTGSPAYFSL
jgi:hypothetical protein